MKYAHLKALGLALLGSIVLAGTAQAQIVGGSSDTDKVRIGESTVNGGPHTAGKVGIHVPALRAGQYVDFQGLQRVIPADLNGVVTYTDTTTSTPRHNAYGRFDFAQVSSHDVYFGEWSQTGSATAGDHTVYYGGTGASSSLPTAGTATYAVKGISDYQNRSILTGTFTADFGNQTLTGAIQSSGGYKVNIGTASIDGTAIVGNSAVASQGSSTLASGGAVNGQFFGTNGSALAGTAAFAGARQYDTAFGGTKN